jgi:hypothetical protein
MRARGYLQGTVGILSGGNHEFPGGRATAVRPSEVNPDARRLQAVPQRVDPRVARWEE